MGDRKDAFDHMAPAYVQVLEDGTVNDKDIVINTTEKSGYEKWAQEGQDKTVIMAPEEVRALRLEAMKNKKKN